MIKRLPLILFILTLASCAFMILIRISGSGTRLLSAKTGTGRFIAVNYNSCVIAFIVILAAFVSVTYVLNRRRKKKKEDKAAAAAAAADETAFDMPYPAEQYRPEMQLEEVTAAAGGVPVNDHTVEAGYPDNNRTGEGEA